MELIWNEIIAERLVGSLTEQTHISGELPVPEQRSIREIVACSAKTRIDGCRADNGEVTVTGHITALVAALDDAGEAFAFESGADFAHTAACDKAVPGMRAEAVPVIQTLEAFPKGIYAELKSDIDLDIRVIDETPVRTVAGVSGMVDLEKRNGEAVICKKTLIGDETLRLREEISSEGSVKVICCEGYAAVRDVSTDDTTAAISGSITVSAVVSDEKNGLSKLIRQVPFREKIPLRSIASDAYCRPELISVALRTLDDDPGLLLLEAEVRFVVYGTTISKESVMKDAFSPTVGFDCLYDDVRALERRGVRYETLNIREEMPVRGLFDPAMKPAIVSARPVITEASAANGGVYIGGVLVTEVLFMNASGVCYRETADVPFETVMENACCISRADVAAECSCAVAGVTAEGVTVQYSVTIVCEDVRLNEMRLMTGLAEREQKRGMTGLIICFASEGEEVYDIAKRYGVPCESVRKLNPEMREPFADGEKLLLMM